MAATNRWRHQGTINLTAGSKAQPFKLQLGLVYREIQLRLKGTLTIPTASNVAANVQRGDEFGFLSDISLMGNSADTLRKYTGAQLRMTNLIRGINTQPLTTLGDTTAAFNAGASVDSTVLLPLWSIGDGKRPIDTALDSSRFSDLRLEVTAAAVTAICTGATSLTGATLEVHTYEHDDQTGGAYAPGGPFTLRREYTISDVISSGVEKRFDLPTGAMYRGFWINVQDSSNVDSATAVTNIKIQSGTTTFYDRPWRVTQQETYMYGFDTAVARYNYDGSGNTLVAPWRNAFEAMGGWVFIDLCRDGYFTEAIDTNGFGDFTITLTGAATGTANIIPVQLFPPRV